jgi:hypothetical protein
MTVRNLRVRKTEPVAGSMERSAGLGITWQERSLDPLPPEVREAMQRGTRCFTSTECNAQVLVSRSAEFGWHLSISHPWRYPTWDEIAAARYALVPDAVTMAMVLPPSDEYVNLHPNCFHLHECSCEAAKAANDG